ncbi:MAG: hypothetical protein A3F31_01410 [Candidatus Levybacteria bacterium RIFCSPHIGHO2_12_FULL_38_12]|nr:MAG: hypothetical protein A3D75_02200 [Candidatus Levybacteria bacterium RIFCSPHIGHO2_02_FULL_37_18]OGH22341.1 MAG: hypothetical protein A3F31_01410 [Candidatus Levybacteria bacterium RIFCSPHIGHO2_12_FULL_38_12]OGH34985.1 MAG: hypothetical protein A3A47_03055 [Candidatus Levybacteria bacterium RIFCSPLOWO2_01_FULL_37_20]
MGISAPKIEKNKKFYLYSDTNKFEPYFEKWMAEDEKKDQEDSETKLKRLGENQKDIETK